MSKFLFQFSLFKLIKRIKIGLHTLWTWTTRITYILQLSIIKNLAKTIHFIIRILICGDFILALFTDFIIHFERELFFFNFLSFKFNNKTKT